jgi:hypothetical protein
MKERSVAHPRKWASAPNSNGSKKALSAKGGSSKIVGRGPTVGFWPKKGLEKYKNSKKRKALIGNGFG